jgi:hypothetical protein
MPFIELNNHSGNSEIYLSGQTKMVSSESKLGFSKKLNIAPKDIFLFYIFRPCIPYKLKIKFQLLQKSKKILLQLLDVGYRSSKLEEIEKLKFIIFKENELALFYFLPMYTFNLNGTSNKIGRMKQTLTNREYQIEKFCEYFTTKHANDKNGSYSEKMSKLILDKYIIDS